MAAPAVGRVLFWVIRNRKKIEKPARAGAAAAGRVGKRGAQWAGTRVIQSWQKRQPDPTRPWTYSRMMGVPEGVQFISRGPQGYWDYKRKQWVTVWQAVNLAKKQSKGKSRNRSRSGRTTKRRKTIRAPSAKSKLKMKRRRGSRCPPGYRYDARRKMCIQRSY